MPTYPNNVPTVTVTGSWVNSDSSPASGVVSFTPNVILQDGTSTPPTTVLPKPTVAALANGAISVQLMATDAQALSPSGWVYQVVENIQGQTATTYYIQLPAAVPTQPLASATRLTVAPPQVVYVPASSVGAVNGVVSAATLTTKGDLLAASAAGTVTREPVGADGTVLTADSTQPTGVRWGTSGGAVTSVAGRTGAVVLGEADITGLAADLSARTVYRGAWVPSTVYAVNDLVTYADTLLLCKTAHTSGAAFGGLTNWTTLGVPASTFNVRLYGAVGDGKVVTDGAMTTGSAILTSATASFTAADQGKPIMVKGAAANGVTTLVTTIQSVTNATTVVLAAANASGGAVSNAYVLYGTDDTAAIQAAINAAQAYGAAHGYAKVYVPTAPGAFFAVAGALTKGGTTKGNAQLTLAPVAPAVNKVTIEISGAGNASGLFHWNQATPQLSGSALVSFGVYPGTSQQSTDQSTNGNGALIGGPNSAYGYATPALLFSNMLLVLKDIALVTTYSTYGLTYTAADFSGLGEANVFDVSIGVPALYADLQTPSSLSAGNSIGLFLPANGNNDNNAVRNLTINGGYTRALYATEHTVINRLAILYCWAALCVVGSDFGSVGASHAIYVDQMSCENCIRHIFVVGSGQAGVGPTVYVGQLDTEGNPVFYDGSNGGSGGYGLGDVAYTGYNPLSVPNPTGIKLKNLLQQPGVVGPPSFTSGTAFINPYWRDATVTLAGITSVAVGKPTSGVACLGGTTAPAMQTITMTSGTIRVPAGGWITITGTPTTNVWILD